MNHHYLHDHLLLHHHHLLFHNLLSHTHQKRIRKNNAPQLQKKIAIAPTFNPVIEATPAINTETEVTKSTGETFTDPIEIESLPVSQDLEKEQNTSSDISNTPAQIHHTDSIPETTVPTAVVADVEIPLVGGELTTGTTEISGSAGMTEMPSAAIEATTTATETTPTPRDIILSNKNSSTATETTPTPGDIILSNKNSTTKEAIPVTSELLILPPIPAVPPVSVTEKSPSITTGNISSTVPSQSPTDSTLRNIHTEIEKLINGIQSPSAQIDKLKAAESLVDENIKKVDAALSCVNEFKNNTDIQFFLKLSPERLKYLLNTHSVLRFKNEALRQRVKVNKGYSLSEIMKNPDYTLSNNSKELNSLMKDWLDQIVKNKKEIAHFEKENPEFLNILKRLNLQSPNNNNSNAEQDNKPTPTASPQAISAQVVQNMLPNWNSSRLLSSKSTSEIMQMANSPEGDNRTTGNLKRNSTVVASLFDDFAKKQKSNPTNSGMFSNSPGSMRLSNYPQLRADQMTNDSLASSESMIPSNILNSQSLNRNTGYQIQQSNNQSSPPNFNSPTNQQVPRINIHRARTADTKSATATITEIANY
ncbi:unnamed protein product [[Candida] boidinii]|nr:unnamed protein product [[Candida] boidinii]